MADIEAVELLTQAKEKILEHGWGKGSANARDMGVTVLGPFHDPGTYCLEDALCGRGIFLSQCEPNALLMRVEHYLRQTTGTASTVQELWDWNDHQKSPTPVLDALDEAILGGEGSA